MDLYVIFKSDVLGNSVVAVVRDPKDMPAHYTAVKYPLSNGWEDDKIREVQRQIENLSEEERRTVGIGEDANAALEGKLSKASSGDPVYLFRLREPGGPYFHRVAYTTRDVRLCDEHGIPLVPVSCEEHNIENTIAEAFERKAKNQRQAALSKLSPDVQKLLGLHPQ